MRNRLRRGLPLLVAGLVLAMGGTAATGAVIMLGDPGPPPAKPHRSATSAATTSPRAAPAATPPSLSAVQVAPLRQIVPPDLLVVAPKGITSAQLAKIRKLTHVRDLITTDGGAIQIQARLANVLGVDPGQFRAWMPLTTASDQGIWMALARNQFVVSDTARQRMGLQAGTPYQLVGASQPLVTLGAAAPLGLPGVDALVSRETSNALGLVHDIAAMINAPGGDITKLIRQVRSVLGPQSQVVNLHPAPARTPATGSVPTGRPTTYLDLYKESAAQYCPGMSWTVLAAIGQIESGHGQNVGPSSAGALGPMQFLPSTWKTWGIAAFGDTTPNVMNPFDAVPSAARYLCASGAAHGGTSLYHAIFAYNHADWYVREVLALAQQYAKQFG